MSINYSLPLSLGYKRMKKALFQPFDITKWFRIGFTAWLAGLTDCNGGSGGNFGSKSSNPNWDEFFSFPQTAWDWLIENPLWANLIIVGIVCLVVFISVLIWISARTKFMFLHNVANNKADISAPWREYRKEGNSLFIFELVWGWLALAVFFIFLKFCFFSGKTLYYDDATNIAIFSAIAQMFLLLFAYIVVFGYISLFLKDFVVPIMYKHRVGVMTGWSKFLMLFGKKFFPFILYGLFILILGIGIGIAVIFFAIITCCIGLLLIAIPYLGAVALLPISYTFRAFSIEFLAQFGDDYNVFPQNHPEILEDINPIPGK